MFQNISKWIDENFKVIVLVAVVAYLAADRFGYLPSRGGSAPVAVDTVARKLGADYKAALSVAADGAFEDASSPGFAAEKSTGTFGARVRASFDARLAGAAAGIDAELSRRVGPPSDAPADPGKLATVQAFFRELREGFKGAK